MRNLNVIKVRIRIRSTNLRLDDMLDIIRKYKMQNINEKEN